MMKRLLFLVIAGFSLFPSLAMAKEGFMTGSEKKKIETLIQTQIINGRETKRGRTYDLDHTITRAEVAKIVCTALQKDSQDYPYLESKSTDMQRDHWAYGYVALMEHLENTKSHLHIMEGYPNETFRPDSPITLSELTTICVKMRKDDLKEDQILSSTYPENFLHWGNSMALFRGVEKGAIQAHEEYILRKDAFVLLYNTFYRK